MITSATIPMYEVDRTSDFQLLHTPIAIKHITVKETTLSKIVKPCAGYMTLVGGSGRVATYVYNGDLPDTFQEYFILTSTIALELSTGLFNILAINSIPDNLTLPTYFPRFVKSNHRNKI